MLSENEIKRLRRARWYSKWTPLLFSILLITQLLGVCGKLYAVKRICERTPLTWSRATDLAFHGFDIRETYSGLEVCGASLVQDASLYLLAAAFTAGFYFVARIIQRRDLALLHYVEQDHQRA